MMRQGIVGCCLIYSGLVCGEPAIKDSSDIAENDVRRFATFAEYRKWAVAMRKNVAAGLYLPLSNPQDGEVWNEVLAKG